MINIRAPRQEAEEILRSFFPAINMYKRTRLKNIAHKELISDEYLTAVVVNCLLTEVERLLNKQLINTASKVINFKFTDAQAVVFYKSLLALPVDSEKVYYSKIRNQWVEELDHMLINTGFYKRAAELTA